MTDYFIGVSSGLKYEMLKVLGEGGQGTVIQVKNKENGKLYAAKWYKTSTTNDDQRKRMEVLVSRGCPVAPDKGIKFIWPIEMIKYDKSKEGFGYIMPLIDTERFVSINKIICGSVKQPNPKILSRISYLLALAIDTIHVSGLAYCDINLGNFMVNTENGDIVICDNDNVVINNSNVSVKGVWEFMAPEVALGTSHPNTETDRYSLAVILFYLWMWEHPMDGKKTLNIYSWDIPAKKKFYAFEPVFVFNPDNKSNDSSGVKELDTCVKRWERMCPPIVKEMFTTVFTRGIKDSSYRIQLIDWQRVFLELIANDILCPKCNSINVWDGKQEIFNCFNCKSEIPFYFYLSVDHGYNSFSYIIVAPEATIKKHHINIINFNETSNDVLGIIEEHPNDSRASILRNKTKKTWKYKDGQGNEYTIEPEQARALIPNCEIIIESVSLKVRVR